MISERLREPGLSRPGRRTQTPIPEFTATKATKSEQRAESPKFTSSFVLFVAQCRIPGQTLVQNNQKEATHDRAG
jgi:hypothetical protein